MIIDATDSLAGSLSAAIQNGELLTLAVLLTEHPGLASARIRDRRGSVRSLLHVATDFPGQYPEGPTVVRMLIERGADPNAPLEQARTSETPLHWAASSDDLEVAEALINGGADIDATGAVIARGTPLDDACAFGCWNVAHMLARRGAKVYALWHAAALGKRELVEELLDATPTPGQEDLNDAFWQACHGGQQRMAAYLLSRGAQLDWHPDHNSASALEIAGSPGQRRDTLVAWLTERATTSR